MFLSEEQVRERLRLKDLIPALRRALIDFSLGRVQQPVRTTLRIPEQGGFFGVMPAVYGDIMGAKLVTFFPGNAEHGIPTHNAIVQLFRTLYRRTSCRDGRPLDYRTADGRGLRDCHRRAGQGRQPRAGDPRQRCAGESASGGPATGARLPRGARLEPQSGTRGPVREPDGRSIHDRRSGGARSRCGGYGHQFTDAGINR